MLVLLELFNSIDLKIGVYVVVFAIRLDFQFCCLRFALIGLVGFVGLWVYCSCGLFCFLCRRVVELDGVWLLTMTLVFVMMGFTYGLLLFDLMRCFCGFGSFNTALLFLMLVVWLILVCEVLIYVVLGWVC